MPKDIILAIVFAVLAGFVIELFFQLVKYRDALNKEGPKPINEYGIIVTPGNYMSVSQYLSGGNRRWINYFLFRLLPPVLILILLSGIIRRYLDVPCITPFLLFAAVISLIPRDVADLFTARFISERLLHSCNIILVIAIVPLIMLLDQVVNLSYIAPTTQGLVDNIWSSLIVAVLVLLYLKVTNMSAHRQDQVAEDTALNNYVVKAYMHIKGKYNDVIYNSCVKYKCSLPILYAVLIYEDMNRPASLRTFENIIVKIFRLNLTVGIAQVRSDRPLTNEESIYSAAKILKGSVYADGGMGDSSTDIQQLEEILKDYNSSKLYSESISQIIVKLRIYANDIFDKKGTT